MAHPTLIFALSLWSRLSRMGGLGLLLLGIADNSLVPMTGSMDVLTIWLAARHRQPWPYYAAMATMGAVLGGYITYTLARKGGREAMEHRFSKRSTARLYQQFERWGFGTIAIPAILPPPFPFVPFLVAAGAMQYSRKKFLTALAFGRGVRYSLAAGLGALYGGHITRFFSHYYKPALAVLIGLVAVGTILSLIQYLRYRRHSRGRVTRDPQRGAA